MDAVTNRDEVEELDREQRPLRPNRQLSLYIAPRPVAADQREHQRELPAAIDSVAGTDFP